MSGSTWESVCQSEPWGGCVPDYDHTQVYVGTCAFHPALVWLALPTPGLPWLAYMLCVNRERKGPRAVRWGISMLSLFAPCVHGRLSNGK